MKARLKRAGQLGLLAKDMAAARLRRGSAARERAVRDVVNRLGLMHGLPQKIGQILSFSDLDERSSAFAPLTDGPAQMSAAEAFALIEEELRRPLEDFFHWIDPAGISASIGQVHRAVLHDGREVAVKVQYPGIAEAVETDLKMLGWLTAPVGDLRRGFDMNAYRFEIGSMLETELDYRIEALNLREFRNSADGWPGLALPEMVEECSTARVLVTTWLDGERISDAATWPEAERRRLAETLVRLFLFGAFDWGQLHADPHPGNYRFLRKEGGSQVGLLDFGCVKRVEAGFQRGLRTLIEGARGGGSEEVPAWQHFVAMGFTEALLSPFRSKLDGVASLLAEPFAAPGAFDTRSWHLGARLADCLGEDRLSFRLAGPPGMIFFLRAFQGLVRYLDALGVPVDWGRVLSETEPAHAGRVGAASAALSDSQPASEMKSEALYITVIENGETRVSLSFGAGAADNLPDLVPQDLRGKLTERSIHLADIAAEARRNDYAPGELFRLEEGKKIVRVWLE